MGSRGSTRAASSKGDGSERKSKAAAAAAQANRSATNFNRGRTLTPKVMGSKAAQAKGQPEEPEMTPEEKLAFDENREEEILKEAEERKARAKAIRER